MWSLVRIAEGIEMFPHTDCLLCRQRCSFDCFRSMIFYLFIFWMNDFFTNKNNQYNTLQFEQTGAKNAEKQICTNNSVEKPFTLVNTLQSWLATTEVLFCNDLHNNFLFCDDLIAVPNIVSLFPNIINCGIPF